MAVVTTRLTAMCTFSMDAHAVYSADLARMVADRASIIDAHGPFSPQAASSSASSSSSSFTSTDSTSLSPPADSGSNSASSPSSGEGEAAPQPQSALQTLLACLGAHVRSFSDTLTTPPVTQTCPDFSVTSELHSFTPLRACLGLVHSQTLSSTTVAASVCPPIAEFARTHS